MALLTIPFFQLFCIPLAVIGATRLWCEEEGLIKIEQGRQLRDDSLRLEMIDGSP